MKKPIKINTNREQLSSDEIKKHQNFKNTWQKQYLKPKPFFKSTKFLGSIILLITIAIVVVIENFEKKEEKNSQIKIQKTMPTKIKVIKTDTIVKKKLKTDSLFHEHEADF